MKIIKNDSTETNQNSYRIKEKKIALNMLLEKCFKSNFEYVFIQLIPIYAGIAPAKTYIIAIKSSELQYLHSFFFHHKFNSVLFYSN